MNFRKIVVAVSVALSSVAIVLGFTPGAKASSSSDLDFNLSPSPEASSPNEDASAVATESDHSTTAPLIVPTEAASVPTGSTGESTPTEPPPPPSVPVQTAERTEFESAQTSPSEPVTSPTLPAQLDASQSSQSDNGGNNDGTLSFQPSPVAIAQSKPEATPESNSFALEVPPDLKVLFDGGTNSLVARAVGSAEGTRTPEGGKTWAYQGHVDPGNGVWNLGTFSYQHGARSPEEADLKQLRRLMSQAQTLRQSAQESGIRMTLEAELNGIDLANQSPRAALSRGGYIDRLKQAFDMGLQGSEAVLWARTRSYLDPDTSRWNAPGLGNNVYSITADQERRQHAIARAIAATPIDRIRSSDLALAPEARREEAIDQPPQRNFVERMFGINF